MRKQFQVLISLNRCVFSILLKVSITSDCKAFHSSGAALLNVRPPPPDVFVRSTASKFPPVDNRDRLILYRVSRSHLYWGAYVVQKDQQEHLVANPVLHRKPVKIPEYGSYTIILSLPTDHTGSIVLDSLQF